MSKTYFVYIMTNHFNTVLYTGVTGDLQRRVYEHQHHLVPSFTSKYHIHKLVYYEIFGEIDQAILREKQIKAGSRRKKLDLIEGVNPHWNDLSEEIGL